MKTMNHIEQSLQVLQLQNEKISLEQDKKIDIINEFMKPLTDNIVFYNDYWEQEQDNIKQKFKQLAKDCHFDYNTRSNHELNLHAILSDIQMSIPMFNYDGEHASDDLPNVNEDWSFEYRVKDNFISLEVIPVNQYSRYPEDPDNNPYQFTYKLPIDIHEKSLIADQREKVLIDYLNTIIDNKLLAVKEKITSTQNVQKKLSSIDFNDPVIVAELKNKLKSLD